MLTGATGYIGGRLVPLLLKEGHKVTVFVRQAKRIQNKTWFAHVAVIEGDLANPDPRWPKLFKNFDRAYYLVHSIYGAAPFTKTDPQLALHFAKAAKNIPHVIYLGGLLPNSKKVSQHLESRAQTGKILSEHLLVTEFRAGPIIGSGSASFEMVRYLTERIPIMVTPKWVCNDVQPIAIEDALKYLLAVLDKPPLGIVDIGSTPISFKDMMLQYAAIKGLRRIIIPLPVLTPALAARWVGLVTPISNKMAVPLIKGIIHPIYADTDKAKAYFPEIKPMSYKKAVSIALSKVTSQNVPTRWTDAWGDARSFTLTDAAGMFQEERSIHVKAGCLTTLSVIHSIGGEQGWPAWGWAWKVRGLMDALIGGPGLQRGRRSNKELHIGDAIDFWRVENLSEDTFLLRAEMKLPGKAWLQFKVLPDKHKQGCRLIQTALFEPHGFWGFIYWYSMFPAHFFIFDIMIRSLAKKAERWEEKKG